MKRALVTGGSGGIGAAVSRRLGADGFHVTVHAHSRLQEAERVAAEIKSAGGAAQAVAFDVTDRAQAADAIEKLLAAGAIQVLVNNAGIHDDAVFPAMKASQWSRVIDVSLNGFYNVTHPLVMSMMATRWGRIINMSSVAGISGNRGQANYAAAKAGLHGATKSLAIELASRGVTVNAIAPGFIATEMTRDLPPDVIERLVPMKRAGTAEEVAALVGFLASDAAGYISGQVIAINGGMI